MILIKSAKIVDGSGKKAPYQADVLISGDKISAIGKFPNKKTDVVIDGLGLYLTPGFIDVNTDSDHYLSLFTNPQQQDFIQQGVTTTFGGMCGSSLAPLLSGNLKSIRKWTDINQINVGWHTLAEFLKILERNKLGVNFGTLVGHSTIRRGLIGEELRDLTEGESDTFKKMLDEALTEGAFGLSTGLGYAHSRNVPYAEIKALAEVVVRRGGVYATHLRNEREGLLAAVEETIRLAEETGVNSVISHFKPLISFESDYRKAVELIHQAGPALNIHFDNYPFSESVVPIYTLLPNWVKVGNLETMVSYINSPGIRERLLGDLSQIDGNAVRISQAPGNDYLVGKTAHQFADSHELGAAEAFLKIMQLTGLRATVFYRNINLDLVIQNLERDQVLIASNGASLPPSAKALKHERFYNAFPRFLEIITQRKMLSLPEAIRKITAAPANKYGLKRRGQIAEGWFADLNLISYQPGSAKVKYVFVNGQPAMQDGKLFGTLAGRILRR